MLIVTTVYCMELQPAERCPADRPVEECLPDPRDSDRELFSIYQGKNRMLPIDWLE